MKFYLIIMNKILFLMIQLSKISNSNIVGGGLIKNFIMSIL